MSTEEVKEEASVEETKTEEAPVEETKTEEAPVEETKTEEAPVEETKTEELLAEVASTEVATVTSGTELLEVEDYDGFVGELNLVTIVKDRRKKIIIGAVVLLMAIVSITSYILFSPGWYESKDGVRFKDQWSTEYVTGLYKIDGEFYFFGEDCYMDYGWFTYGAGTYYAGETGMLARGEYEIEGQVHNFDEDDARLLKGWFQKNNNLYYYSDNGIAYIGMQVIEERTYYFDAEGVNQKGIIAVDDVERLFTEDGTVSGVCEYEGKTYLVNEDCSLFTGPIELDDKYYYFNLEEYYLQTGWIEVEEQMMLFVDGGTTEGLCEYEDETYLVNEDYTLYTGLIELEEKTYYFDEDTFIMTSGWQEVEGAYYYFDLEENYALTGWQDIDGKTYYFNANGTRASGMVTVSGKKYYFIDGIASAGWHSSGGYDYYFISGGGVYTGTQTIDGKEYYFLSTGALAEGWVTINGVEYYYLNNKKVTNTTTIGGNTYYFNDDGSITTGWYTVGSKKYYNNKYGVKVTGWQTISGNLYYFQSSGAMATSTTVGLYSISSTGVATKEACNSSNLNDYLDDFISRYGATPAATATAVRSNMSYKYTDSLGSTAANAIYAINNKKGACYHYASFHYELCTRLGYKCQYIIGINGHTGNQHGWIAVYESGTWIYYDSLYDSVGRTAAQMKAMGYQWDE